MPEENNASRGRRRRKLVLSAEEKLQVYQQLLSGELSQRQAAERWDVDPPTIMRIRRVAREGALGALRACPRTRSIARNDHARQNGGSGAVDVALDMPTAPRHDAASGGCVQRRQHDQRLPPAGSMS